MTRLGELDLKHAAKEAAGNWQRFNCFVWFRDKELKKPEDWAVIYLDGGSEQPFVIWKVSGEASYHIWPEKTDLWPPEAMAMLRDKAGQQ